MKQLIDDHLRQGGTVQVNKNNQIIFSNGIKFCSLNGATQREKEYIHYKNKRLRR